MMAAFVSIMLSTINNHTVMYVQARFILTVSDHVHLEYERISASTRDVHDHEQLVYKSSVYIYSVVMYVAT